MENNKKEKVFNMYSYIRQFKIDTKKKHEEAGTELPKHGGKLDQDSMSLINNMHGLTLGEIEEKFGKKAIDEAKNHMSFNVRTRKVKTKPKKQNKKPEARKKANSRKPEYKKDNGAPKNIPLADNYVLLDLKKKLSK
jgi:hypothetical protein